MGGSGSGRRSGLGRDAVEDCRSIDANRLHKAGRLRPGRSGGWQWTRHGETVASITLHAEADRLHLSYRVPIGGDEWADLRETIRIVRVRCRLGGSRPYFICPGVVNGVGCGRRISKVYLRGGFFLCRQCQQLAYASQRERSFDRASRRAIKIRRRLGGDIQSDMPFPERPKGMWRSTYERWRKQGMEADRLANEAFLTWAEWLVVR